MDKLKILVVDDESRMRKLVKDFLVKAGYDVIEAGDGEQAVDTFYAQKDIALIILDVMMPKMDGWRCICRSIPLSAGCRMPAICRRFVASVWDECLMLAAFAYILWHMAMKRAPLGSRATPVDAYLLLFIAVGFFLMCAVSPNTHIAVAGYRAVVE